MQSQSAQERIGDVGRIYLHDDGSSGGAATVVADASGSGGSERGDERIGGDAEHSAGGIYRGGGSERNRIGEFHGGDRNGVYFENCCVNTNNAYYKFTGAT